MTVQELLDWFSAKGLTAYSVSCGQSLLYNNIFPKHKDRLGRKARVATRPAIIGFVPINPRIRPPCILGIAPMNPRAARRALGRACAAVSYCWDRPGRPRSPRNPCLGDPSSGRIRIIDAGRRGGRGGDPILIRSDFPTRPSSGLGACGLCGNPMLIHF
jgi:hypothetical protein